MIEHDLDVMTASMHDLVDFCDRAEAIATDDGQTQKIKSQNPDAAEKSEKCNKRFRDGDKRNHRDATQAYDKGSKNTTECFTNELHVTPTKNCIRGHQIERQRSEEPMVPIIFVQIFMKNDKKPKN